MKFRYTVPASGDGMPLSDSRGKMVKRPLLQIILKGKDDNEINSFAMIDSGADTTTLNIQYANFLGINLDKSKTRKTNREYDSPERSYRQSHRNKGC